MLMVQKQKTKKNRLRAIRGKCARGGLRYPSAQNNAENTVVYSNCVPNIKYLSNQHFFLHLRLKIGQFLTT